MVPPSWLAEYTLRVVPAARNTQDCVCGPFSGERIMGSMHELTNQDYRDGWRLVCEMSEAARDAVSFARHGAER